MLAAVQECAKKELPEELSATEITIPFLPLTVYSSVFIDLFLFLRGLRMLFAEMQHGRGPQFSFLSIALCLSIPKK